MARPREFNREEALERAAKVFWSKGYAATSTDDLLGAMEIGRQSLYNTFGDKRSLYSEALGAYQQRTTSGHLQRLTAPASPLQGIRDLLLGLVVEDAKERAQGCMGVGSVAEFGKTDAQLNGLRAKAAGPLLARLVSRIRQGQRAGEMDPAMDQTEAANFILLTMTGIQLAARGGAGAAELRRMAQFATDRLAAG